MKRILITGGTGTIGKRLIERLKQDPRQTEIRVLSRSKNPVKDADVFSWNIEDGYIEEGALKELDVIIHLSGFPVSERWTPRNKKLIRTSRIEALELIKEKLGNQKLPCLISASGISIYGTQTSTHIFKEEDTPDHLEHDFLGKVSQDWEAAALGFKEYADKIYILRTPIVLSPSGGALEKMTKPIKYGVGSPLGTGQQWMPWVHLDDLCSAYINCIFNEMAAGTYNICAPDMPNNSSFTQTIAEVLGKPLWAPKVPEFALKLLLGEMAQIVTEGSRVDGTKFSENGGNYHYRDLKTALISLLKSEKPIA